MCPGRIPYLETMGPRVSEFWVLITRHSKHVIHLMQYVNVVLISNLLHNFFTVNPHPVSLMTQLSALYYMKNISTFSFLPSSECVANVKF
jgi:hypothetical protein